MRRQRLLIVLVLGLLLAGGAIVGWQARGQARLVERDLAAARELLGQAGGFSAGQLEERLVLIDRAEAHTLAAERRLDRPTLRLLGALPLAGRDVRVARVVAASATGTVRSTAKVVTALQPIQAGPPTGASIRKAADALGGLHRTLEGDLERVRAARPLLAGGARDRYLKAAAAASATAGRAGQALELAAGLYGPPGTTRWFLALQNPAELRGTGGLIGEYGILESSPSGPRLVKVAPYEELDELTRTGVGLPRELAGRYERFAVDRAWSAVNIPPDMPTVGRIATELYRKVTGDRIDGVIAADPLAVAEVLRAGGPIRVGGVRLTADNVAQETLVRRTSATPATIPRRRRFLQADGQGDLRRLPPRPGGASGRADAGPGRGRPGPSRPGLQQRPGGPAGAGRARYRRQRGRPIGRRLPDDGRHQRRRQQAGRLPAPDARLAGPPGRRRVGQRHRLAHPRTTPCPGPACPGTSSGRSTAASGSASTSRSRRSMWPAATASPGPA